MPDLPTNKELQERLNNQAEAISRLHAKLDELYASQDNWLDNFYAPLETENKRLREALENYGHHIASCQAGELPSPSWPDECTCGFYKELNKADTK